MFRKFLTIVIACAVIFTSLSLTGCKNNNHNNCCGCCYSGETTSNNADSSYGIYKKKYEEHSYSYLSSRHYDEQWKNELIKFTERCYNIYQLDCLKRNKNDRFTTDYENIILIGSFSLYSNKKFDNYVCFSGSIRVFEKDLNGYWKTNQYLANLLSNKNMGRSDFISYNAKDTEIQFSISDNMVYLGTYGTGVSTYWDVSCVNYTLDDILKTETSNAIWSDWCVNSSENWYYRIEGEDYWTYNLQHVIL